MSAISPDYIEIRQNRAGQPRAYIVGTRVRVQDIYVEAEIRGQTPDGIVAGYPHLTLAQVHAALAYYFDHSDAIKTEIREERDLAAAARSSMGPGPLEEKLKSAHATSDPISP
jgi:uncharacterized protein (DUF433 family)